MGTRPIPPLCCTAPRWGIRLGVTPAICSRKLSRPRSRIGSRGRALAKSLRRCRAFVPASWNRAPASGCSRAGIQESNQTVKTGGQAVSRPIRASIPDASRVWTVDDRVILGRRLSSGAASGQGQRGRNVDNSDSSRLNTQLPGWPAVCGRAQGGLIVPIRERALRRLSR